jgi:4-diphosphocytidyl-2-C-methyl-D-erythritol kinase
MISFPNCKINLGLYVTAKRPDGYHNLETIFFPIPFTDVLEFIPGEHMQFNTTGLSVPVEPGQNLCLKAYQLLKTKHPSLPPLHIHLHKVIPMGAGLGGGSADAAFMLSMLNRYFQLGMAETALMDLALQLGSDCPFFIWNKPAFATGRGEMLEPVALHLSGMSIALVNPGIHVSTAQAFAGIRPRDPKIQLKQRILEPVSQWRSWLSNDFEQSVALKYREINFIKDHLYEKGALYASMTGSGSTVYGIFDALPAFHFPGSYLVKTVQIK